MLVVKSSTLQLHGETRQCLHADGSARSDGFSAVAPASEKVNKQRLYILPTLKRPRQTDQTDLADKRFKDGCKGLKQAGIFFFAFFAFSSATIRDFEIDITLFIRRVI